MPIIQVLRQHAAPPAEGTLDPFVDISGIPYGGADCVGYYDFEINWADQPATLTLSGSIEVWLDTDGNGTYDYHDWTSPTLSIPITAGAGYWAWVDPTVAHHVGTYDYSSGTLALRVTMTFTWPDTHTTVVTQDGFTYPCT